MTETPARRDSRLLAGGRVSKKTYQLLRRLKIVLYNVVQHPDILKQVFTKQVNELTSRFSFLRALFLSELHTLFSCPRVENSIAKRDHIFQVFEILKN